MDATAVVPRATNSKLLLCTMCKGVFPQYFRRAAHAGVQQLVFDRTYRHFASFRCLRTTAAASAEAAAAAPSPPPCGAGAGGTYISELFVKDFALVEEATINLQPGLTVITGDSKKIKLPAHNTAHPAAHPAAPSHPPPLPACPLRCACPGESGSGKSVLVVALGQLLGATAAEDVVRPPATVAELQAVVKVAERDRGLLRRLLAQVGVPQRATRGDLGSLTLRRELMATASKGEGEGWLKRWGTSVLCK